MFAGEEFHETNLNRVNDPSKPPPTVSLIVNSFSNVLLAVLLWRSWRTPAGTKSTLKYNKQISGTGLATPVSRSSSIPRTPRGQNFAPMTPTHARVQSCTNSRWSMFAKVQTPTNVSESKIRSGSTTSVESGQKVDCIGDKCKDGTDTAFTFNQSDAQTETPVVV